MKTTITFFSILITAVIGNAQSWSPLTSGSTSNLKSIHFPTASVGYAVGDNGTILKTSNGGTSWSGLTSAYPGYWFWDVHFTSTDTGYVCGEGDPGFNPFGPGIILKTTNGGVNWTTCMTSSSTPVRDLFVLNKDTVFACGGAEMTSGRIIKTVNGGTNWTPIGPNYVDAMLGGMYFLNSNNGFLGVYESVVGNFNPTLASWLSTTDGSTFTTTVISSSNGYWNFASDFPDSQNGYMTRATYAGDPVYLRKTTDGGTTWTENIVSGATNIYGLDFIDAANGYMVGDGGVIKNTTNGGSTWSTQTSGSTQDLRSVYFVNNSLGFAAGANGTILKYTPITGINESDAINFEIFPNPASSSIYIVSENKTENVTLLNSLGETVLNVSNQNQIDVSAFASGIYYVVIRSNNKTCTRKIVITK